MTALTPRQSEAFQFIRGFIANHGYSPSFDDIRSGLDLTSKSAVHRILSRLEERGAIRRRPNMARAIEIVADDTAEQHLRRILSGFGPDGILWDDSPCIEAARQFLARRA
jgi:SOS-response transcriptional repressor LexA